jgi:hypothetical protein
MYSAPWNKDKPSASCSGSYMPKGKGLWYSMERWLGGPISQFGYDAKRHILAHVKNSTPTMVWRASYFSSAVICNKTTVL